MLLVSTESVRLTLRNRVGGGSAPVQVRCLVERVRKHWAWSLALRFCDDVTLVAYDAAGNAVAQTHVTMSAFSALPGDSYHCRGEARLLVPAHVATQPVTLALLDSSTDEFLGAGPPVALVTTTAGGQPVAVEDDPLYTSGGTVFDWFSNGVDVIADRIAAPAAAVGQAAKWITIGGVVAGAAWFAWPTLEKQRDRLA